MRKPDFENNTLRVLRKQKAARTPLFEIFLNNPYYARLAGFSPKSDDVTDVLAVTAAGMAAAGYDYVTTHGSAFRYPTLRREGKKTASFSHGGIITDRASFDAYEWPDPDAFSYEHVEKIAPYLVDGQKLMVMGPGGILENAIDIIGYDELCYMTAEDPELLAEIFDNIGSRMYRYYENCAEADTVGFICYNDDWGFNTQTFLSPADMRKYVYPWVRRIVSYVHSIGKPVLLHSCGYYANIIDDIIDDLGFDARHSYEDNITPIERAYEEYNGRIVAAGGIDMNFLATSTPEAVYRRASAMLDQVGDRGLYMLGSGNSIPEYIPFDNLMAMNRAALERD